MSPSASSTATCGTSSAGMEPLRPRQRLVSACRTDRRESGGHGISLDRAGHASRSAPAAAELGADDRHDVNALVPEVAICRRVALVAEDHAGRDRQEVVAVIPLLA